MLVEQTFVGSYGKPKELQDYSESHFEGDAVVVTADWLVHQTGLGASSYYDVDQTRHEDWIEVIEVGEEDQAVVVAEVGVLALEQNGAPDGGRDKKIEDQLDYYSLIWCHCLE